MFKKKTALQEAIDNANRHARVCARHRRRLEKIADSFAEFVATWQALYEQDIDVRQAGLGFGERTLEALMSISVSGLRVAELLTSERDEQLAREARTPEASSWSTSLGATEARALDALEAKGLSSVEVSTAHCPRQKSDPVEDEEDVKIAV